MQHQPGTCSAVRGLSGLSGLPGLPGLGWAGPSQWFYIRNALFSLPYARTAGPWPGFAVPAPPRPRRLPLEAPACLCVATSVTHLPLHPACASLPLSCPRHRGMQHHPPHPSSLRRVACVIGHGGFLGALTRLQIVIFLSAAATVPVTTKRYQYHSGFSPCCCCLWFGHSPSPLRDNNWESMPACHD